MDNQTPELFTASAWGALPQPAAIPTHLSVQEPGRGGWATPLVSPEPPTFIESLGFPRDTPPRLLATVLEDIHATAPVLREQRLLAPGMLSRLFSHSAAQASYALAILSIVKSRHFAATLERLRRA